MRDDQREQLRRIWRNLVEIAGNVARPIGKAVRWAMGVQP